jgi:hypothetical protein
MLDASLNISDTKSTAAVACGRLIARLRQLPRADLLAMYDAAVEATQCFAALAERGANPVTEVLGGTGVVEEWGHFPPGDVFDPTTHSQYYYHAHAAEERVAGEHGHFHTFVRPKPLYPELQPAVLPNTTGAATDKTAWIAHLVGISTDASGRIIRLFTTNRWVTGEAWYDADTVVRMLDRFDMTVDGPSPDLNRWVTAVVQLFHPQIADLIHARDARIADFQAAHPERDVYEDRELQVTSEMAIDFLAHIRAIEDALGEM